MPILANVLLRTDGKDTLLVAGHAPLLPAGAARQRLVEPAIARTAPRDLSPSRCLSRVSRETFRAGAT
jgi:hypothetical protein